MSLVSKFGLNKFLLSPTIFSRIVMGKILVTGSCGQVGSELIPALANMYGKENVIASDISSCDLNENVHNIFLDVTDRESISLAIQKYDIDSIFHLAAILSATGEKAPSKAFSVNIGGTFNILEEAVKNKLEKIVIPSTIGIFGPETPKDNVPIVTVTRPTTMYGITKVTAELLGNYYFRKFNLDVRGLRFPGLLSYKTKPTSGTTDYAVEMFYYALEGNKYTCFLKPDTELPMMYMPDAVNSLVQLYEADVSSLRYHMDYNVSAFSFTPSQLAQKIREHIPEFEIDYEPDYRQNIAESWPRSLDYSDAKKDWNFAPEFTFDMMVTDMIENLSKKIGKELLK